jgi:predicted permease
MAWFRRLVARLRYRHFQDDVAREIEHHRALKEAELIGNGASHADARHQSARDLGNITLARENARAIWIAPWLESLWQDARYALRGLRRQPGLAAAVVLILAVGSGLVTVLFAFAYGMYLRPWPVRDPESVAIVRIRPSTERRDFDSLSIAEFRYLEAHARTVDAIALTERYTTVPVTFRGVRTGGAALLCVSRGYFNLVGMPMIAGRDFSVDEHDYQSQAPVVVLSRALWRRQFGSDLSVVGQPMQLGPSVVTIVGVSSMESFVEVTGARYDVALPLAARAIGRGKPDPTVFTDPRRQPSLFTMMARMPSGAENQQTAAELATLSRQFRDANGLPPVAFNFFNTRPVSRTNVADSWRVTQLGLLALVLVQLLACANVGNLLLARGLARRREMAIRQALGAGRRRLVRQLLIESALLSAIAGALALALAYLVPSLILQLDDSQRPEAFAPGAVMFLFCFGLTVWTTIICGLAPALRVTSRSVTVAFTESLSPKGLRLRRLLLSTQIALATVLLVAAGLLTRAVAHASHADPGFLIHDLQAIEVRVTGSQSLPRNAALLKQIRSELQAAGASQFAFADDPPLSNSRLVLPVRHPHTPDGPVDTFRRQGVSPNYFEVVGVALLAGRPPGQPREIVVSQTAARSLWPDGSSPISRRLLEGSDRRSLTELTVVGVAEDVSTDSMTELEASIYVNSSYERSTILVRDLTPAAAEPIRRLAAAIDPEARVRTYPLSDNIRATLTRARIGGQFAWGVAALGLLLSTIGAFGVFACAVEERRREIGIRMALGARRVHVTRAVWRMTQGSMAIGLGAGLVLAVAGAQLLRSFLHGLSPFDPIAYLQIAAILFGAAALATWIPARRAARVDPAVTLRTD